MKILYHHRTAADDGQAVHIRELQAAFRRAGHDLREIAIVKRSEAAGAHRRSLLGAAAAAAPAVARELMEQLYDFAGARALRAAIAAKRPDIIYERYALSTACGARVARECNISFVVEVNSPLVDEVARTRGLRLRAWARRKELYILRSAAVVAVVSGALAAFARSCGVASERIVITPNGVDLAKYEHLTRRADLIERYQLAGKRVVGFTGFVRDWHRLDLAIEAMSRANLHNRNVIFMIVGDGPALAAAMRAAREHGVEQAVRFCGRVKHGEIHDYVALFDIALVTAINPYASPLKLFEYMAAGAAPVVVDQENLREVLDNNSARFFPAGDAAALARAVADLAADEGAARAVGARARALVRERDYTWDGNVKRIAAALDRVRAFDKNNG